MQADPGGASAPVCRPRPRVADSAGTSSLTFTVTLGVPVPSVQTVQLSHRISCPREGWRWGLDPDGQPQSPAL